MFYVNRFTGETEMEYEIRQDWKRSESDVEFQTYLDTNFTESEGL